MQTLRAEHAAALPALEPEWRRLADASDNVFATWEWLVTWWRHFGRDRALHLTTVRGADGAVVAILPLYCAARVPLRVVRFLGHGPSDQLGPVCAPGDRRVAADALSDEFASGVLDCDLLIADELPRDASWRAVRGATVLAESASPVVRLAGVPADDVFARRSAGLRAQLGRKRRGLDRLGKVTVRTTVDPEQLAGDLTTLFALHDARWRATGGSRAFAGREAFHREFAALALTRGWLRLRFLEVDGHAVAALYNLRFAGAESNYQAGRDPAFASDSVGLLLHAEAIRAAIGEGCTEYRFLRGGEEYKQRFADADAGLESIVLARGRVACAAVHALRPVPRLPRSLRRRVPATFAWGTGGSPVWGRP